MSLQLDTKVIKFLKNHPNEAYTARKIAEWIFETYPDECRKKKENSRAPQIKNGGDHEVIQQIAREIYAKTQKYTKKSNIRTIEERPRRYYIEASNPHNTLNMDNSEVQQTGQYRYSEHDLYPLVSEFLSNELNVRSRRIDEKRSRNSKGTNGNKWLHPDLVGLEHLSADWEREVRTCANLHGAPNIKLWSFEVKRKLYRSDVREYFFQTVSNSSWAHFSYLVTTEIHGDDTMTELRILTGQHGVGVIQLDPNELERSQILIPARERHDVDWPAMNRIAAENSDFKAYIKTIRQFHQTGELRGDDWDYNPDLD